ncbi:MAG TPA: hypothetical protein VK043_12330 [Burkholderiales bacterium]|nr:hypothetical protein [Burkholderiales bacterium]
MKARWIRTGRVTPLDFDEACVRLAIAQPPQASPILLWGESAGRFPFALIVPLRLAPGRRSRWAAWGLAPAIATYRQFGVPAYFDEGEIRLGGRTVSETIAEPIGECAVVASSFLAQFPESCVPTPSSALEQAFRLRLEAQHGWQFEHSWPTRPELLDVALA